MDKSKLAVNTYNKIADVYTKEYFDDLSDAPFIDKFLELLPLKAKILDIGSGPGQFSKYIKEKPGLFAVLAVFDIIIYYLIKSSSSGLIIFLLMVAAVAIVLYIGNIIAVNQLVNDIHKEEQKLAKILNQLPINPPSYHL